MSVNETSDGEFKNFWHLVFNQSRVNGAEYFGDRLPSYSWDWPRDTFLQKRLNELRKHRGSDLPDLAAAGREPFSRLMHKRQPAYHEQSNWRCTASGIEEH